MKQTQLFTPKPAAFLVWILVLGLLQGCLSTSGKENSSGSQSAQTRQQKSEYARPAKKQVKVADTNTSTSTTSKTKASVPTINNKPVTPKITEQTETTEITKSPKDVSEPEASKTPVKTRTTVTADSGKATAQGSEEDARPAKSQRQAVAETAQSKAEVANARQETQVTSAEKAVMATESIQNTSQTSATVLSATTPSSANPSSTTPSSQIQLAMAESPKLTTEQLPVKEKTAAQIPAINLTIEELPYAFEGWTLERNWDNQHPQTCRLRSAEKKINDGYDTTYLWAEILPNRINVYTGSNIDLNYEGSGLQFGFKPALAFSGLLNESSASIAGDFSKPLIAAKTMTLYLGFWPTWPQTETQKVTLDTKGLAQAIPVFQQCQNWSE